MIKETTALFYVACDTDDCDGDGFDEYVPYYETREQALANAIKHFGFTQLDEGTLLCHRHAAQRQCTERGHDWEGWQDCHCDGRAPEHADQCRQHRSCKRCSDWDPHGDTHPHRDLPPLPAPYAVGDQTGRLVELWNWKVADAISSLQGLTLYLQGDDDGWQATGNSQADAGTPVPVQPERQG